MIDASFSTHTLPTLANWSQLLGGATLVTGVTGAYFRHQCQHPRCPMLARHRNRFHGHPTCKRHREHTKRP